MKNKDDKQSEHETGKGKAAGAAPREQEAAQGELTALREAIDRVDRRILEAVAERQALARQVYAAKRATEGPIFDAAREACKRSLLEEIADPGRRAAALAVQETLMRVSREAQYRLRYAEKRLWEPGASIELAAEAMPDYRVVAVQGNASSYGAQAARALFPEAALIPAQSFEAACQSLLEEMVEVCVLPLENSSAGTVEDVYALIEKHALYIVADVSVAIRHCLAGLPGSSFSGIRRVLSHPQALSQCSRLIKGMGWQSEAQLNTAFAAERVALLGDPTVAAIASEAAARQNGLVVLSREVSNVSRNQTRFVAVARRPVVTPAANKLSLLLQIDHQSGGLARALALIADYGLNLSKIQSRPLPDQPWRYAFYVDIESPRSAEAMQALYALTQELPALRFLGWYEERRA